MQDSNLRPPIYLAQPKDRRIFAWCGLITPYQHLTFQPDGISVNVVMQS
jgi:hypothetical protein